MVTGSETVQHQRNWKVQTADDQLRQATQALTSEETKYLASHLVEARVAASLQDPEEQEAAESERPNHRHQGRDDRPSMARVAETERQQRDDEEVEAAHEVGDLAYQLSSSVFFAHLIELQGKRDGEGAILQADRDDEGEHQVWPISLIDELADAQ